MLLSFVWGDDGDLTRLALSFEKSNAGSNCYFSFPCVPQEAALNLFFKGAKISVPEPVVSSITIAECHRVRVHKNLMFIQRLKGQSTVYLLMD